MRAEEESRNESSSPWLWIDTRPLDRFSQAESRARRLKGLDVQFNDSFDLVAEVDAVLRPFAASVGELTLGGPLGMRFVERVRGEVVRDVVALRPEIDAIGAAVHELRLHVTEALAGWRSLPADGRTRVAAVVRESAHGAAPAVSDAEIAGGGWVDRMVAHVELLSVDLSSFLGDSPAPGGCSSKASQELRVVLRQVDYAASVLERRIRVVREAAERVYRERRVASAAARAEDERVARDLARLGL